jgi:hypothetical protein
VGSGAPPKALRHATTPRLSPAGKRLERSQRTRFELFDRKDFLARLRLHRKDSTAKVRADLPGWMWR